MPSLAIHHVLDSLAVGGAETLVCSLARFQQQAGHRVVVHCRAASGPLAHELQTAGIPVLLHNAPSRRLTLLGLFRTFRRYRPDVVHCHNIAPTVLAAPVARIAGVPCVVSTRHGTVTRSRRRERKFWLAARFCWRVVAVSHFAAQQLASGPWARPDKLTVILNGAALPPALRAGLPLTSSPRPFTLISVGRLHRVKDFPSLLRAVALATASFPHLRLWILGDGPERTQLESLASELGISHCVKLLGSRNDVGRWLAQADVFVLASLSEGVPIALLEAFAAGLPAVVTAVGGMPEVVQCCGAGVVVPPSQPEALAQAILDLAHSPDRLKTLGELARGCYARHFTLERVAADYLRLYMERLAPHRP